MKRKAVELGRRAKRRRTENDEMIPERLLKPPVPGDLEGTPEIDYRAENEYLFHQGQFSRLIKRWFNSCIHSHERICSILREKPELADFLPTRLIDLGPLDQFHRPRLAFTRNMVNPQEVRYIALSHAWGYPDESSWQAMTTTTSSLPFRLEGGPAEDLPRCHVHLPPLGRATSLD